VDQSDRASVCAESDDEQNHEPTVSQLRDVNDAAGRCIARLYQFSDYLFSTGAQKQFGLAPRVGRQQLKEIMTGTVEDMDMGKPLAVIVTARVVVPAATGLALAESAA